MDLGSNCLRNAVCGGFFLPGLVEINTQTYPRGEIRGEDEGSSMDETVNRRKEIAERIIARWAARGTPIDRDPAFMALVEQWADGHISTDEMQDMYLDLVRNRRDHQRPR